MERLEDKHPNCPIIHLIRVTALLKPNCMVGVQLFECPTLLQNFYHCLYKELSPACHLMPPIMWQEIETCIQSSRITQLSLKLASQYAPGLEELLVFINLATIRSTQQLLMSILELTLSRSKGCFETSSTKYVYLLFTLVMFKM
jgi:hypothetical protein